MDWTPVITACIGAAALIVPANWARKAARNTKPMNGQTVSQQVDQLHRLFVSHDAGDQAEFRAIHLTSGELSKAIMDVQEYSRDRWHRDDGRYAVTLALMATLSDTTLPEEQKAQRFRALYEAAQGQRKWDGTERREDHGEVDH